MSSPINSSAEFCSPSFDRALAELPMTSINPSLTPKASTSSTIPSHLMQNNPTSSPDWPNEDELAMVDEIEAEYTRNKRKRGDGPGDEDDANDRPIVAEASEPRGVKDISQEDEMYEGHPAYVASKFGGIGAYMQNKRMKLQIQNAAIAQTQGQDKPQIFKGLEIYINGYTVPPLEKLRTMIVQHGGTYVPYLDRKGMITHILATNLTPAKFKEFASYKVATPDWIVESVQASKLLDWRKFKLMQAGGEGMRNGLTGFLAPREGKASPIRLDKGKAREVVDLADIVDDDDDDQDVEMMEGAPVAASMLSMGDPSLIRPTGLPIAAPKTAVIPPVQSAREIFAPTKGQAPPLSTDPITFEGAAWMGYAKNAENKEAKRLMQNGEWREQNTAVSEHFLEGYYKNSRLHHLSTWKSELKTLVAEAQKRAEQSDAGSSKKVAPRASQRQAYSLAHAVLPVIPGRSDTTTSTTSIPSKSGAASRVIMHVDFDAFFVSCGLASRPELRGKPVVVCHAQGNQGASSTSEIASCSYEARAHGVKNGMSLGQARGLCADIRTIPYEFDTYREKSLTFYTILMSYADEVQAVSIDEALIDVSQRVAELEQAPPEMHLDSQTRPDYAKLLAEDIRADMREATDCEVSIGVSSNILLARLATRHAKPAGSFHLTADEIENFMAPLDVGELHNFGYATKKKIESTFKTSTCGELVKVSRGALQACLGEKNGQTLYNFVRGIDPRPLTPHQERRSVSAEVNYGIRFITDEEVYKFLTDLSEEVARRMKAIDRLGRLATLKVMVRDPEAPQEAPKFMGHGVCNVHNRSAPLSNSTGGATDDGSRVANAILKLYRSQNFDPKELRGIGIQVQKLESRTSPEERLPGQQALGFISKPDSTKQAPSLINRPAKAAGKPAAHKSRPVFQAVQILPADIDRDVWSVMDTAMQDEYRGGWRMAGIAIPPAFQRSRLPQASLSPRKTRRQREESNQADEIEVTAGTYALEEADLAHAGISAADYAAMDPEVQRELMRALETKRTLFRKGSETPTRMKAIKAISDREIHVDLPTRPTIRMGSTEPLQDLDSVLDGLSVWMEVACKREPNMREVKVLIKYLKRCLDPTTCNVGGVQSAIQALSWWERLCKTKWPTQDSEVGRKWLAVVDDTKGEVQHILSSRYQ